MLDGAVRVLPDINTSSVEFEKCSTVEITQLQSHNDLGFMVKSSVAVVFTGNALTWQTWRMLTAQLYSKLHFSLSARGIFPVGVG